MGDILKYKNGNIVYNSRGRYLGIITKAEKIPGMPNKNNRYELELLSGTKLLLDEHQIIETEYHKNNNKD